MMKTSIQKAKTGTRRGPSKKAASTAGSASAPNNASVPMGDKPATTSAPAIARVAVLMGSDSDWPTLKAAYEVCTEFGVVCDVEVVSAHRTPTHMAGYAQGARTRGLRVLIAGAGGAAHLPGMLASHTTLPVIGVPVESHHLKGLDSLLSIVQMPGGVPVATMAIGGARNAGLLALEILALGDETLLERLETFKRTQAEASLEKSRRLRTSLGLPVR